MAVTAAFGGSLLADDLRGSPAAAAAALDECAPDPLLRGIVDALAGEAASAVVHLREAGRGGDERTRGRAAAWAAWAATRRSNTFPGDTVADGLEVFARWPELASHPAVPDQEPGFVELEQLVLTRMAPRLRFVRSQLRAPMLQVDAAEVGQGALDELADLHQRAVDADELSLAAAVLRWRAELLHLVGDRAAAERLLDDVAREAIGRDDHAAAAACDLLRGDLVLAPFSHPLAADLALTEAAGDTSELPWAVEYAEADPAAVDVPVATAAYEAAASSYARAVAPRGLVAVALRQALLARLTGDDTAAVQLAERAANEAAAAGDAWLLRTAQVHTLLARTGAGRSTASLSLPEEVAAWGISTGSYSQAFGLGLLLARAGRQFLVRAGDPDRASTCHALAGRIFAGLDARLQRSQSLADRGVVAAAVGDAHSAAHEFDRALQELHPRLVDPTFGRDAWRRAISLGQRLHQLALGGGEPAALRRSAMRLQDLLSAEPSEPAGDPADLLDGQLRTMAETAIVGAELHAALAEGDRARDDGASDVAAERYGVALAAADAAGDDLGRAVTLARLQRPHEALAAYHAHETAVEAQQQSLQEQLRAALGADAPALPDPRGGRLRREAAFLTRVELFDAAAEAFDALDAHEPGWWHAETRPWELLSDQGHVAEQRGEHARAAERHAVAIEALGHRAANLARDEARTALHAGTARVFGRAARTELRLAETSAPVATPSGPRAERSFVLAETGRARALAELLAATSPLVRTRADDGDADDLVAAWMAASARVSLWQQLLLTQVQEHRNEGAVGQLDDRLREAERELLAATDALQERAPSVAHAMTPPAEVTLEQVCATLTPGAVLVSHLLVDDDLLTFAATPEGLAIAHRQRVDARDLTRTLLAFSKGCATGGHWVEAGRSAARLLLDPVADVLDDADRLTFVPTGVGHAAPLHALPWRDDVLLERAPVAVVPSATTLSHLRAPVVARGGGSLVVGDPEDMVLRSLTGGAPVPQPPLPYARAEAVAVARWLDDPVLLTGPEATTAAVRAELSRAGLVHLATHAHVDVAVPAASALLLARGDALRLVDLIGARMSAQLVVLSACESGRGQLAGGDEVLGMTRALLAAGVSSAVVSLWPVDDVSTGLLMSRFAATVAAGSDPVTALREGQRWYRSLDAAGHRDAVQELAAGLPDASMPRGLASGGPPAIPRTHPYHWAPFIYVGAHPAGPAAPV
ncbi:CHAT domain-containing protein [Egicoccus sp. AB-alg6-2]|uniref:CHAT domain-containing protein n=1 Tax=Egicoccus sp. AB-alg6-2 TaxID=3242692 RepID=UPI00359DA51A